MSPLELQGVPGGYAAPSRLDPEFLRYLQEQGQIQAPMVQQPPQMPQPQAPAPAAVEPQPQPFVPAEYVPGKPLPQLQMGSNTTSNLTALGKHHAASVNAQAEAIRKGADIEAAGLKEIAKVEQERAQAAAAEQQKYERIVATAQPRIDEEMAARKKVIDDIASSKIDTNRLMHGGRGIAAAIGVALGSVGSALTGTPNYALQIVNSAIERDVEAQKLEMEKRNKLASMHGESIEMQRQSLGDQTKFLLQRQAMGQASALASINAIRAQMAPGEAQAKTDGLIAGLQAGLTNTLGELQSRITQDQTQRASLEIQRQNLALEREKAAASTQKQQMGRDIPDLIGGEHADEHDLKKVKEVKTDRDIVIAAANELLDLRRKYGSEHIAGPVLNRMRSLATTIKLRKKNEFGLGQLSDSDNAMLDNILNSDPGRWGFVTNDIEGLIKDTESSFDKTIWNNGRFKRNYSSEEIPIEGAEAPVTTEPEGPSIGEKAKSFFGMPQSRAPDPFMQQVMAVEQNLISQGISPEDARRQAIAMVNQITPAAGRR